MEQLVLHFDLFVENGTLRFILNRIFDRLGDFLRLFKCLKIRSVFLENSSLFW